MTMMMNTSSKDWNGVNTILPTKTFEYVCDRIEPQHEESDGLDDQKEPVDFSDVDGEAPSGDTYRKFVVWIFFVPHAGASFNLSQPHDVRLVPTTSIEEGALSMGCSRRLD